MDEKLSGLERKSGGESSAAETSKKRASPAGDEVEVATGKLRKKKKPKKSAAAIDGAPAADDPSLDLPPMPKGQQIEVVAEVAASGEETAGKNRKERRQKKKMAGLAYQGTTETGKGNADEVEVLTLL